MLRPLSTRTSPSMCGTSVVRIRSDFSGDTTTPTLKVSSMSSIPTIEIELMRTEKSSTKCSPNRNSQEPSPAQRLPTDLASTPSEEEPGSSSPHALYEEMVSMKVSTGSQSTSLPASE